MRQIKLPFRVKRPILACGADLKGAFAVARGAHAFLSDGFGDLSDIDNLTRYEKAIRRAQKDLKVRLKIIACDMHSGYFSTRFAENAQRTTHNAQLHKVQHHEAHVASAMVDNFIKGDVIGVAFDGTGLGSDGNIWGGEFFVGGFGKFKRTAHFKYIPMPGMDMAVREPWRMAVSYLYNVYGNKFPKEMSGFLKNLNKIRRAVFIKNMIDKKINSPLTSSAGRLFDAVGSMIIGKYTSDFEAQLPIELERTAEGSCEDSYEFDMERVGGMLAIETSKTIRGIVKDVGRKTAAPEISAKFHNTVAEIILKVSSILRKEFAIGRVVLSGGVFQNKYLTDRVVPLLKSKRFKVFTHNRFSTNDSGVPMGQLAIANAR